MNLLPGDVFVTDADSLLGWAIRKFSRTKGEAPSRVNHTGLIVGGGEERTAVAVEALSRVEQHPLWEQYGQQSTGVRIWRPLFLTPMQRELVAQHAVRYVGYRYGYTKIAAHAIDRELFGGAYKVRRWFGIDAWPICSYLVAMAYKLGANYDFGVDVKAAQPDDIDDWCGAHPEQWQMLTPLLPLTEWPAEGSGYGPRATGDGQ